MEAIAKKHLIYRIVAIGLTVLATVFMGLSLFVGLTLPHTYSFAESTSDAASSLVVDTNNNLYYSTQTSIVKADEDGQPITTYNLIEDINKDLPDLGVEYIRTLCDADFAHLIAVCELNNSGYLFLIDKETLKYSAYTKYEGRMARNTFDGDNFVIATYRSSLIYFARYSISDLSSGVKAEGFLYNIKKRDDNVILTCSTSATVLQLAVVDNDLYAISTSEITIMDLDFSYNNFHTASVYDKWKDENNVDSEFNEKYGFVEGDINKFTITLDYDKFDEHTTYFNVDSQSNVGGFADKDNDIIYLINASSKFNSINASAIRKKYPERNPKDEEYTFYDINLKGNVTTGECCTYSSDDTRSAFVVFHASDKIANIDINGDSPTLKYSFGLEFNIKSIVQNKENGRIYYLFNNKNKSGVSGVFLSSFI